jgi:hypothetical protein
MRLLRGLAGAVLWILAAVVGLLGVVLCVTVILLPLGIPLVMLARRLFTRSVRLMLPRSVAHPVDESGKSARKKGRKAKSSATDVVATATKQGRKGRGRADDVASGAVKKGKKVAKKGRKAAKKQRKRFG